MKKQTSKEALEETRDLWQWLADNPLKLKSKWPKYRRRLVKNLPLNLCPLCEYAKRTERSCYPNCNKCPLKGRWTEIHGGICEDNYSPYSDWAWMCGTNESLLSEAALRLVTLCNEALEELEEKGL